MKKILKRIKTKNKRNYVDEFCTGTYGCEECILFWTGRNGKDKFNYCLACNEHRGELVTPARYYTPKKCKEGHEIVNLSI